MTPAIVSLHPRYHGMPHDWDPSDWSAVGEIEGVGAEGPRQLVWDAVNTVHLP
jgi:hypothetical protein